MSADNLLMLSKRGEKYVLQENNASTGSMIWNEEFDFLGQAINKANHYMQEDIVEYGLNFNL